MNSTLVQILKRYLKSLNTKMKIEKKSQHTIKSYNYTFNSFFKFLKDYDMEISLLDISEEDIYAFLEYKSKVNKKEISNATSNATLSHLKKLFGHIERNARKESFDFRKVFEDINIKATRKKPKGMTLKEQEILIRYLNSTVESNPNSFLLLRNSFLIKLMLHGGLRVSEALSISINDLNDDNNMYEIEFVGKGKKERFTVIEKSLIENEIRLLKQTPDLELDEPVAVTNNKKSRVKRENLYLIVNRIYERAGLDYTGLHILRHTFAKNLIENKNKPITIVQSLLGHSSLQTTSIYTNPTREAVVASMRD